MKKKIIAFGMALSLLFTTSASATPIKNSISTPQVSEFQYIINEVGIYFPVLIGATFTLQVGVSIYDCVKEHEGIVQTNQTKLPRKYEPNAIVEIVSDSNQVIQRRYYDEDGEVAMDIDLTDHGNPKIHSKNHKHIWSKQDGALPIRQDGEELTEEEYFKYIMVPRGMCNKDVLDEITFGYEIE